MTRTIYLAIFSNGLRPAHYAVFIPSGDAGTEGKIIHVTGTAATGFFLEFKRNYDFTSEQRKYQLLPLAQVNAQYLKDTTGIGQQSSDTTACDRLESSATTVPPPGRSANPFHPSAPNCQNWMRDYIHRLVTEGLIPSTADSVVRGAPRLL
ncbi:hypothetical protein FE257_001918 [Aspergillus nanangensis]|uniref:Uncharacterized protein n=1 Tax=Aspergillus nanangensis TaxID=2582783 RepID=A0AAD4CDI7_ASPNN|nr:hypothetical protein FE257_001918 [Aspergillus nanangensis]